MTKRVTAAELLAQLQNDPEFVAKRDQQSRDLEKRGEDLRAEEAPLLADLRAAGCEVTSVWDLVNRSDDYASAVPVLLAHLDRAYSNAIRDGIARALGTPSARAHWATLVERYRSEHDPRVKDALAAGLSALANDSTLDSLLVLASDGENGPSRTLLLRGVAKLHSDRARRALAEFVSDPALGEEAKFLLRTTPRS